MKTIHAADIREWRNRNVVDSEGHKIGVLEAVYVDTATDESAMATVRIGLPTRQRLAFVPLGDAILGPDYVKVSYAKAQVKKAPSIGTDDILPAEGRKRSSSTTAWSTGPGQAGRGSSRAADLLLFRLASEVSRPKSRVRSLASEVWRPKSEGGVLRWFSFCCSS